ncbi:hypothetical protein MD484_g4326, partial [Candolleomyces efflorescens]
MHPKLLKADFHGCILTVKQSKNACLVGLTGILIHETENGFKIVTRESKVKRTYVCRFYHPSIRSFVLSIIYLLFDLGHVVIPKQNSIFTFAVPLYSTLPPTFKPGKPYPIPASFNVASTQLPNSGTPEAQTTTVTPSPSSGPTAPSPSPSSSIFTPNPAQTVLDVPHLVFELYGNQFRFRSSERAGRKFKHKESIEL